MARVRTEKRKRKSKAQRIGEWLMGRAPTQVTVTPTLAITATFSLAVTFAVSTYAFVTLVFQDTGWEVAQTQASTAYSVLMSQEVVIEENLEVKKGLTVQDDIRILGSVLDLAGSDCGDEGLAPTDVVRLCFEETDHRLKASSSGGDYVDLMASTEVGPGVPGPTGPQGPTGPRGPAGSAGQDGQNCWDLDGDGQGDRAEDTNGDGVLDARDCRESVPAMRGVIDIPQPPTSTLRQAGPQCVEVQLSSSILDMVGEDDQLLNVQLTPRGQWLPVYSIIRIPSVFICASSTTGGVVDYDIRAVSDQ